MPDSGRGNRAANGRKCVNQASTILVRPSTPAEEPMPNIPEDIFTEPATRQLDTLANLGPLRRLAGEWQSDQGVGYHPKAGGPERRVFREHIELRVARSPSRAVRWYSQGNGEAR